MKEPSTKVRVSQPKTWVKYRPSLCQGCRAGCCTMPVQVTSEELYHMGFVEYDQVNGPLKRIAQRLIRQGIVASYNDRNRNFILKQYENNDCVFLDEDRMCKIYDRRPNICRVFPGNSRRPGFCPSQRKS